MKLDKKYNPLIITVIALVMIISAGFIANKKASVEKTDVEQGRFLNHLQGNADKVAQFILIQGGKQVKIILDGDIWVIPEKYNYPVEIQKIRNFVTSVESYEVIEKKTDSAERLKDLGLENPENSEVKSLRVVLTDKDEKNIFADFIIGDKRKSGSIKDVNAIYVRNNNENQAWLVTGAFNVPMNFHELLSNSSYFIKGERIERVVFSNGLEIARADKDSDFKISGSSAELKDPVALNNLGTMLEGAFIIGDVAPASAASFKDASSIDFKTFDGLVYNIKIINDNGQYWVKISASGTDEKTEKEAGIINAAAKDWIYRVIDKTGQMLTSSAHDYLNN